MTVFPLSTKTRAFVAAVAASGLLALGTAPAFSEAALLVDADSGRVLYADNATHPWYPASVTKIMTAYVILKAVKEGRIALDKPLTVSENAVAQSPTKMGFAKGTQVTVDNALKMLMVKSANDMAVLLAEGLSGSIEGFAMEMNQAAERLGMTQTSYVNTLIDRYPGADGMKTGFICASGFNLVATATRGSRRLIAVVLGSRSGLQRAEKAAQLLERGFTGGGGLSWLIPAFGTVNALQPVDAAPPNLRDDICGKGRRAKPPADSEEEPVATAEPGSVPTQLNPAGEVSKRRAPSPSRSGGPN